MEKPSSPTHVILIGPMGAGKTTIGRAVAESLGLPLIDSDDVIEARTGMTGAAIARGDGLGELHAIELDVFLGAASSHERSVICPGESVVDDPEGRSVVAANLSFWIAADHEALRSRHVEGVHRRTMSEEEFLYRRSQRDPHLEALCIRRIDTTRSSIEQAVVEVCRDVTAR